ncbi:hypothetical protein N658DRAFT_328798 [Parathielavia hyrcaniae]|uniref:Uncharacterized protein n=1 Tax=Parathielavia hyrcaniae TaxID=113614 RepID=A0AAN6Q3H7_9PEZI|nr:hypothetical protein N658DRAFT_328798 [Parathielavia hyrcaniae]
MLTLASPCVAIFESLPDDRFVREVALTKPLHRTSLQQHQHPTEAGCMSPTFLGPADSHTGCGMSLETRFHVEAFVVVLEATTAVPEPNLAVQITDEPLFERNCLHEGIGEPAIHGTMSDGYLRGNWHRHHSQPLSRPTLDRWETQKHMACLEFGLYKTPRPTLRMNPAYHDMACLR